MSEIFCVKFRNPCGEMEIVHQCTDDQRKAIFHYAMSVTCTLEWSCSHCKDVIIIEEEF